MSKIIKLVLAVLICQGAGLIGAVFTSSSVGGWYKTLTKPSFNPPSWLFGPVWISLYLLMGVSLYLVWIRWPEPGTFPALVFFGVQLILNTLWSVVFFGIQRPGLAFLEIIFLFAAISVTVILFFKISRPAAYLMIPYLLWVAFASVLNGFIWRLN
jgi:benzodiazapine receptor